MRISTPAISIRGAHVPKVPTFDWAPFLDRDGLVRLDTRDAIEKLYRQLGPYSTDLHNFQAWTISNQRNESPEGRRAKRLYENVVAARVRLKRFLSVREESFAEMFVEVAREELAVEDFQRLKSAAHEKQRKRQDAYRRLSFGNVISIASNGGGFKQRGTEVEESRWTCLLRQLEDCCGHENY